MQYMFKKSPTVAFNLKSFYVMECGIFIGKIFKVKILSYNTRVLPSVGVERLFIFKGPTPL